MPDHSRWSLERLRGSRFWPSPWRRLHTIIAALLVVALAALAASLISIPYYAITPGSAQPVAPLIGVPSHKAHHHKGQVLLVDVELVPLRAIEWPWFALDPNAEIVGSSALLGPESAAQYNTQGVIDMRNARQAAKVVALRTLGYHVKVASDGALIYALLPGSPAEAATSVGDVVTAVDGGAVTNAVELSRRLRQHRPGDLVSLRVVLYPSEKSRSLRVRLSAWRIKGRGARESLVCPPYGTGQKYRIDHVSPETGRKVSVAPCIGVLESETSYRLGKLPISVNLSSEGIIGPSAGLAFTLGLISRLDPYDLTGGQKVAATGTMSIDGKVGEVGGVAQKTVAVRGAGAKIFLVPPGNYKTALRHAGGDLKVYKVSSVAQAIRVLERYGGKLPKR